MITLNTISVIDSRKKRPKDKTATQAEDPATASLFPEERTQPRTKPVVKAQNRLTHAQLRELEVEKEKEIVRGYRRLQEVWAKMMEADEVAEREWMVEAEKMVETFRETRNLFMTSRVRMVFCVLWLYLMRLEQRLPRDVPTASQETERP